MIDYKNLSNEKEKTTDQYSTTPSIDYPLYLQNIKYNLQQNLVNYQIDIINRQMGSGQLDLEHTGLFSIIITSQKPHAHHYELLTQTLINEQTYSFIIKHMIIFNNRQVQLRDKLSINAAVNLVMKMNKFMDQLQLIVDPVSGKIYFQTKSFINQTSLSHLKKNNARQDCFYTQMIAYSLKKVQDYMDLILYLIGRITLSQLITNPIIRSGFPFLLESQQRLRNIQKSIACFGLFSREKQTFSSQSEQSYGQNDYENSYQGNSQNNQTNLQTLQTNKARKQKQRIESQNLFRAHLFNSLEFYTPNIQQVFKLYCRQNVYSNIDVAQGFKLFQKIYYGLCEQQDEYKVKQLEDLMKNSEKRKRILTIIDVIGVDGMGEEQEGEWRLLSEGGFGVVQTAMVRFKSLSSSYHQYLTSIIRQQLVRKRDKLAKKLKIKRQRKILQKIQHQYHPNITNFYVSFQFKYEDVLFSDYTPHMSLDLYINKNQMSVSFSQRMLFMIQAIEGLMFLHSHKIVHLDIKPGNMLVHKSLRVQLSDFGEAFVIGKDDMETHQHAYTIPYCAPEIFYKSPILTEKADIYAIGVCLLRQVLDEKYLQTFLKKKFTYRLSKNELYKHVISEKFQNSFMSSILKIIQFVSILAVSQQRQQRPGLGWIREILDMCREFIIELIY